MSYTPTHIVTNLFSGRRGFTKRLTAVTAFPGSRDSFSAALLPFLEGHFSRIVLAHNQDGFWRTDLIERFHPDVVVSEVVESGTRYIMAGGPPASDAARARISAALATPHRVSAQAAPKANAMSPAQSLNGTVLKVTLAASWR